eukprot:scaffold56809_cov62-Phaeocystis_antarctica.AAC.2
MLVARHLPARAGLEAVQRGLRGPWAGRLSHLGLSVDSLRVRRHELEYSTVVRLGRDHWVRRSAHPPHPRTAPPPTLLPLTRRTGTATLVIPYEKHRLKFSRSGTLSLGNPR